MEYSIPFTLETPAGTLTFNDTGSGSYYTFTSVSGMDGGSVRATADPVPQSDGAFVYPAYLGALYPVFAGQIVDGGSVSQRASMEDTLRSRLMSILRADGTLKWTPSGKTQRQRLVRLADRPEITGGMLKQFQFALVAADPLAYSVTLQSVNPTFPVTISGNGPGWFIFTTASSTSTPSVVNGGTMASFPRVQIHGPVTSPTVTNMTTGALLSLPGLVLSAAEYAEVDMRAQTVTLNGVAGSTLLRYLDVANSDFWSLVPGTNTVQIGGTGTSGATSVTVIWRDAWA